MFLFTFKFRRIERPLEYETTLAKIEQELKPDTLERLLEYELKTANVHDGPSRAWPLPCNSSISPWLLPSQRPPKMVCSPRGTLSHAAVVTPKEHKSSMG